MAEPTNNATHKLPGWWIWMLPGFACWFVGLLFFGEAMAGVMSRGIFSLTFGGVLFFLLVTAFLFYRKMHVSWWLIIGLGAFPVSFILYAVLQVLPLSLEGSYPLSDLWNAPFKWLLLFAIGGLYLLIGNYSRAVRTAIGIKTWELIVTFLVFFGTYFLLLSITF